MKILVIDNFDSFTYNLVHYLEGLNCEITVMRNTEIDFSLIQNFDKIILSPGPGLPKDSGELLKVIELFNKAKPILGVCLGMQALAYYFDENLYNLNEVKHGVQEKIQLNNSSLLFSGIPKEINVGLYHSWAVKLNSTGNFIEIAKSASEVIMAIEHKNFPLFGVQFHPESILSDFGKEILSNFVKI